MRRFPTAAAFADALERAARETDAVATHKDVAAYLDEILGVDIVNQRETVRSWIARGEPSRPKSLSMPPPAPTAPTLPRLGQRPLSPESTPSSGASVASAVISNHGLPLAAASQPLLASAPAARRGRPWVWVLAAGALTLGTVGVIRWSASRDGSSAPPRGAPAGSALSSPPAPPASPPPQPNPGPVEAPPVGSALTGDAASATAPALPVASASAVRPAHPQGPRTTPSSPLSPSPSNVPVPDDISRNPYR